MDVQVNQETCIHCKNCARICPLNIIDELEEGVMVNTSRLPNCIACGHCMAACPSRSVQVQGFDYNEFGSIPKTLLDSEGLDGFLRSRRSIRHYKDKPISKEVIDRIIEIASCAPMGMPPSNVEILIINDRDRIQKQVLSTLIKEYDKFCKQASNPIAHFLIKRQVGKNMMNVLDSHVLPIAKLAIESFRQNGTDSILYNCPAIMLFHSNRRGVSYQENCLIAMVYARLAAESVGLGCCINGMAPPVFDRHKGLRQEFGIPSENTIVCGFTFGYPRYRFTRTIPWKFKSVKII